MFKIGEIRELIRLIDETSVSELKVESEGMKLHIKKNDPLATAAATVQAPPAWAQPAMWAPPQPLTGQTVTHAVVEQGRDAVSGETTGRDAINTQSPSDSSIHLITSPMVGTFYRAPSPENPPFVEVGSKVTEKSVVCIVEAMKLMNEIEAEVRGEVIEVLAENGQLVEYGQPLFRIKLA